uniref:Type 4a pilus biogenesis protein PilO n=1 Tax=candidate division WWE3 bacterium TaxID=2053526 RepID=A0A832E0M0_UNCKA
MATTVSFLNRPEVRAWGPPTVFFLLGILLIMLGAIPSWGKIQDLQSQISTERDRIAALEEKNGKLLDFADQSNEVDKQFKIFDQAIASESKVPELLTQVQTISDSCGTTVTTLQFGGESGKAVGSLQEVRIQYASESYFSELVCLIAAVEKASRLIDMESLRYNLNVNEDTGEEIITAQATLLSYYTPTPQLLPDTPVTFSLSDPKFLRNADLLKEFKVY